MRNIPKDLKHIELEQKFTQYGKVKSLKVSLNEDHSSRGYGFICFDSEEAAESAVEGSKEDKIRALIFQPKDRRDVRKLVNNVYIKNIPAGMTQEEVEALFAPFGNIISTKLFKNEIG